MNRERNIKRQLRPTGDDNSSTLNRGFSEDLAEAWLTIEVNKEALTHNMMELRRLVAQPTRLMAVVKADAYGHGLLIAARAFLAGSADALGVHSWTEAWQLRADGLQCPIIILGPVNGHEARKASAADIEITVASLPALYSAAQCEQKLRIHLKVETGVNRQGLTELEMPEVINFLASKPQLEVVGLSSHFADIEDTTDHEFARSQMKRFQQYGFLLGQAGLTDLTSHMTCSAATMLWPGIHGEMARVGISAYGIWPSRETQVSFRQSGDHKIELRPALTWKCRISQIREVPAGQTVGYGRSWKAMVDTTIAVLPLGYSDGYPRALGGRGHVLIQGFRAPLVGRICMNLCMVDVSSIPEVQANDEVVLLGRQGEEVITAEMLADQLGTIAYEVITWPGQTWTRVSI